MREFIGACALLFAVFQVSAFGEELTVVTETKIVEMLNNFELLAEKRELPYAIRVIRLGERGECDGTPQSCPMATLYIAVSTFDQYPDQQVYQLPKAYGWEFVQWKALARNEGPDSYTVLEVKRKIISNNPAKSWWSESRYEIQINPWKGRLSEIHK
jgi:hypothetical protein